MTALKDKLSRNAGYTFLAHFMKLAVGFALLPYIVATIGKERFGLWVIVAVVTQYCGLADLGIAHPLSKYIAEFYTRREPGRINQVVTTGFAFYAAFGIVVLAVVYSLTGAFLRFFALSPDLYPDAAFALRIGVLIFVLELASGCVTSVLRGLQRIDVTRKVQMLYVAVNAAGTLLVLKLGYGLRGLFLNDLACFFATAGIEIWMSFVALPTLRIARRFISREMFGRLFGFGIRVQVDRFSTLVGFQFDKILIGYILAVGMVAYYEIGAKVSFGLRQLAVLVFPILVPAFSELSVRRSRADIHAIVIRLTKVLAFAAVPGTAFVVFAAPRFITAWMGPAYALSARTTQILSVGYLTNILPLVMAAAMQGMERPHFQMWYSIIFAVFNLILSVILLLWVGYIGAPLGTCIAMIASAAYFGWAAHRFFFRLPLLPVIRAVLVVPCAASLMALIPPAIADHAPLRVLASRSRTDNLAVLAVQGVMFLAGYLLLARLFPYFSREEREEIDRYVPWAAVLLGRRP